MKEIKIVKILFKLEFRFDLVLFKIKKNVYNKNKNTACIQRKHKTHNPKLIITKKKKEMAFLINNNNNNDCSFSFFKISLH